MIRLYKSLSHVALFLFVYFNTSLLLSSTVCSDLHLSTGFSESNRAQEQRNAFFLCSSTNSLPVSGNSMEESYSGLLRFDWQLRATPGKVCSVLYVSPEVWAEVLKWNRRFWSRASRRTPRITKNFHSDIQSGRENTIVCYTCFCFWTRGKSEGIWRNSSLKTQIFLFVCVCVQYLPLGFNTLAT